jgi:hypothetical protein
MTLTPLQKRKLRAAVINRFSLSACAINLPVKWIFVT